jgi:hypothetical protein
MAFAWTTFRTAMRTAIGTVWADVLPGGGGGGIWPLARIERVSFEGITVPFASIDYGAAGGSEEWSGVTRQAYLITPTICYVFAIDTSTDYEEVAAAKAEAMEDYLLATGLTTGQVIDVVAQDVTPDDPLLALILEKAKPYYAGAVVAEIVVGE